ncbi:MAG: tetratricopeptide repeat protein [Acidobacteria bacterium]|nr:tetratricopeptide repeat protein [Acidobacteriota bacterium]
MMRATLACALVLVASVTAAAREQSNSAPTFARDIAPVVFDACASCHRPGGPAPFSLTTHREVRQRATQILEVTRSRFMPPWKVEPSVGHFEGQRQLSSAEIAMLADWVAAGTPEGVAADTPPRPTFSDGWLLGPPDLIVTLPEAFVLQAEPTDVFRIFAMPLPVPGRRYVRGIEFHPGNARVVHHANIRVDRTPAARQLDAQDPLPGYDGLMPRSAEYPDGHFLGWTPGQVAPLVASDLAWTLEPGSDLVVQLHLQPSGAVERVNPVIGLYFGDAPPTRTPTVLRLGSQGIDMPPGDDRYVIRDSYTLPVDADLLAIQPHAHYRAKEIIGTATFPDGTTRRVMHIRDWDFRWQHVYRLVQPLTLPRGTKLSMEYTYDNSSDNPRNPEVPPARVRWGQRSNDEMGDLWFQLLAKSPRDRDALNGEINTKMLLEDIIGYETMLQTTPNDFELHDDVALLYLGLGKPVDAVRHFEASVTIRPQSPKAHYNLGTALAVAGRMEQALPSYERALALDPDYAAALGNMGSVLLQLGRSREAVQKLERAVRLSPTNIEALNSLSAAYAVEGDIEKALATIERALKLDPPPAVQKMLRQRREMLSK